ncbi:dienelactone hydrolase family protein [Mycobacterium kansasii 732]|uniref:dienelactone hydrolase family protein n=2 Tax=Mycobacterium pseudokansasii TaxID=2341080 RepID=UPI000452AE5F|nr:dienelactone hydrolase family protein [Mycobacterium pseudokansasii]EUA11377.1 dienelactone hydrolase family protein [Mycobacterium kansasii 732]KZS63799.1 carboxymethylenebutenolidase [Mycobacterium kansasii]VBA29853.1 Carboxymethylenebutenolidase [Mycobacterium pseudokansasii]VBA31332.1 Carboxymethylenebutenolidase [Mycobacterium pseudokansasii]
MNAVSPDAIRAETVTITGHGGDEIEAYRAMPLAAGSRGGIVWIHHMPGYDRETKEFVRRLAVNGYHTVAPNLYSREAPGAEPDDAAAAARAAGGVPDERLVGDVAGAVEHLRSLPGATGRFGVIGHCSGGRHAYLAACSLRFDAAVDCYGAFIVEDPPEGIPKTMKPIRNLAANLSCPLLGLFGVEDRFPAPDGVAALDAELTRLGKPHSFTSYEGAGHAFFSVDRPAYRVEAALDGWRRINEFFAAHLKG